MVTMVCIHGNIHSNKGLYLLSEYNLVFHLNVFSVIFFEKAL